MATFGFQGTVNDLNYARMQALAGPRVAVESPSAWLPSVTGADRTVSFAAGAGYILGLRHETSGATTVQQAANATGSLRIDLIVARADWTAKTVTFTAITGSSPTVPPAISKTVLVSGDKYDFPLCVCLTPNGGGAYAAGDIRDIRAYGGSGGLTIPQAQFLTVHDMIPGQTWRIETTGLRYEVNSSGVPIAVGPTVSDTQDTTGTSGSTTYTATLSGGTACGVTFTAPPSGRVMLFYNTDSFSTPSVAFTRMSVRVRTGSTIGSGTIVLGSTDGAMDAYSIVHQDTVQTYGMGRTRTLAGLTPGSSYNAQTLFRTTAGTGSWSNKELTVSPME